MIREWLDSALGEVIEASNGSELRIDCPFCAARVGKADSKHHMYISNDNPVAFCFRCGWQGNYISLIMSVSGCSYSEALKQLSDPRPNINRFDRLFSPLGTVLGHQMSSYPDKFKFFNDDQQQMGREEHVIWNYLVKKRRISKSIVRKYMGWASGTWRAWILVDKDFWQGRAVLPGIEPKYISSPWPKGDTIWNPNALNDNHIYICEGVFSALAVGSHAIALCAKTVTEPQAKRIVKSNPPAITIMLDADATQFAYDMAAALERYGYCGILKIHELEKGDPTDGLDGMVIGYDWSTEIARRISTAV